MLYVIIVAVCGLLISAIVTLASGLNFFYVLLFTVIAIAAVVVVDALVATVSRLLPASFAQHDAKVFTVPADEKKFYEKLKIRKWIDKVPEIGQFTGFRKNKIVDPKSVEYLERFLLEICYGEIGHFYSCFFGFLILLLFPISEIWFAIAIPVAVINALMNLPSLFILRYNSYKLEILRKNLIKRQEREKAKQTEQAEKTPNTNE